MNFKIRSRILLNFFKVKALNTLSKKRGTRRNKHLRNFAIIKIKEFS